MYTRLTRAAIAAAALPASLLGATVGTAAAAPHPAVHQVVPTEHRSPPGAGCRVVPGHWERKVWYGNNPGFVWVWIPPQRVCA